MSDRRPDPPRGPWLVVGLARSGVAVARVLAARGETVVGVDAGHPDVDLPREIPVHLDSDGVALVAQARAVVKSPGVPGEAPVVVAARERGLPVLSELEVAWRLLDNEVIAVTGTNGKTTTVELIGHIHREAGLPVRVAGNVGTALSSLVGEVDPAAVVVCEASSFQLEDTEAFAPQAAVLLNITEDHLDRHGTMEAYTAAKLRIFAEQDERDVAVVPVAWDAEGLGGRARRVRFGAGPDADLADRAGELWWGEEPLIAHADLALPGAHNRENAMAAAAVCLARGVPIDAVRRGLATFGGVPHRLETVATVDGVRYVNDSKATNVASTIVALAACTEPVHLILGGQGKDQDFRPLRLPVADHVLGLYLIGEDAERLAGELSGAAPLLECGTLEQALALAREAARPGEVILLSPACASFDQFADFEARGEAFRALAAA